jgi:hypothetical protein
MPRRFALDQNFPEPIVNALVAWLRVDAELIPIRAIDSRMATIDDWEILHALHTAAEPWDGLVTTDARMLSLPKELALLCQTKLTLVVAEAAGHDPIKATGLILAHIGGICQQTRIDRAQVWRLRTNTRSPDDPWEYVTRVAERHGEAAADLYARERLAPSQLPRSPLRRR